MSNLKKMVATSTTLTTKVKESKEPPAGATIINETIRTETEQIENGWLVSKSYDTEWKEKGKDGGTRYSYYTKKWFSKTDPLEIKVNEESLADAFKDVE